MFRWPSRHNATKTALSVETTRIPSTHLEWALLLPVRGRLGKRSWRGGGAPRGRPGVGRQPLLEPPPLSEAAAPEEPA